MLHRRYLVSRLRVGGRSLALVHGDLLVAARAETGRLDWEAIVSTVELEEVSQSRHRLELDCVIETDETLPTKGAVPGHLDTFRGDAFLVRAVDRALVFRGDGPLEGVDLASLRG
ncbi:MAG TPA: hypothetical protein VJM33_01655 [Microthrixaceae bacterium]|nr:hypothetical protein [Microthrixaceae bacterium]